MAAILRRALLLLAAQLPLTAVAQGLWFDSTFQRQLDRYGIPYQIPHGGKALLVNIPSFELVAFENGTPQFRSRVIVGTPWHPTPLLETSTTKVRFRPTWRPTPSMVASGEYVDRIWPPGTSNPLGLAAVHLADNRLVYLHDTNRRELFAQENRALSHGCIRVQAWDQLVAWVLDMPLEEVHRLANGPLTFDVEAPAIPVSIRYLRTFIGEDGQPLRHFDIYGRDKESAPLLPPAADTRLACAATTEGFPPAR